MPTDGRVLDILDSGLRLTPAVITENIDKSWTHVSRRLSDLTEYDLVERPKRGYYQLTDSSTAYLSGELDAVDLENKNE